MSVRVVATSPSFSKNPVLAEVTTRHFPGARLNSEGEIFTPDALIQFIGDADALIVGLDEINEAVLEACPNLKIVARYGVGLDNLDQEAMARRGVALGWTGGVNKTSVAEEVLGLMLGMCRNLFRTCQELKGGIWDKSGGCQLSGKTVGIVGMGHIGKELVRLLAPFHCRILVNDIIDQADYYREHGLEEVDKPTLFSESDLVTLHTPLSPETRHMVNEPMLALMKPTAYLINTARGAIVKQDALKEALLLGRPAGAALDVYEHEPPADREFLELPNLICTPHIGGNAREAVEAMGMSAIHHLAAHFGVPFSVHP